MIKRATSGPIYSRTLRGKEILLPEEERRLMKEYHYHKDESVRVRAREKLLLSHQRLVFIIADKYAKRTRGIGIEDLLGEGNLGLLDAMDRFDPERGVRFSTYAAWWVRAYVSRYARSQRQNVRVDTSKMGRRLYAGYSKARHRIEHDIAAEFDESPSYHQDEIERRLARHFQTSVERIKAHEASLSSETSIDTIGQSGNRESSIEIGVVHNESDAIDQRKLIALLEQTYEILSPREKNILMRRFGIGKDPRRFEAQSFAEIAREYDLSRERIRQIEQQAIRKLRASLEALVGQDEFTDTGKSIS